MGCNQSTSLYTATTVSKPITKSDGTPLVSILKSNYSTIKQDPHAKKKKAKRISWHSSTSPVASKVNETESFSPNDFDAMLFNLGTRNNNNARKNRPSPRRLHYKMRGVVD